jgi:transcriptional regulator with XRE-family HTH domain
VVKTEQLQAVTAEVSAILRRERERQNLSMSQVAERAGLSQQMVSYMEREMRNPTLESLLRVTAALKVSLAEVISAAERKAHKRT